MAAALALLDAGAAGQTAKELDQLLHTGLAHQESHGAVAALLKRYQSSRGEASLDLANRIWVRWGYSYCLRCTRGAILLAMRLPGGKTKETSFPGQLPERDRGRQRLTRHSASTERQQEAGRLSFPTFLLL